MDSVVSTVAQYALYVVAVVALVVWLFVDRSRKVGLAVEVLLAAALVAVLVKVGSAVHTDPRPFAVDPSVKPLFAHSADNGFPSDHTALATAVSLVVATYGRAIGVLLVVVSLAIGVARIEAHVHHVQDIVGGIVIGAVAAGVALLLWRFAATRLPPHLVAGRPRPAARDTSR